MDVLHYFLGHPEKIVQTDIYCYAGQRKLNRTPRMDCYKIISRQVINVVVALSHLDTFTKDNYVYAHSP